MTDNMIIKVITIILSGFVGFLVGRLIYKILTGNVFLKLFKSLILQNEIQKAHQPNACFIYIGFQYGIGI